VAKDVPKHTEVAVSKSRTRALKGKAFIVIWKVQHHAIQELVKQLRSRCNLNSWSGPKQFIFHIKLRHLSNPAAKSCYWNLISTSDNRIGSLKMSLNLIVW